MNKPEQSIITSLLEKHALGICTQEEMALLEQWYAAFPEKGNVWTGEAEKAQMKEALKTGIFKVIADEKVYPIVQARVKRPHRIWWQAAAVAALLVITFLLYDHYSHKREPDYVVVSAPAGKDIVKIELPDHSQVWLEPGTTLRYRKAFSNKVREIELADGMAFFSVRKNAKLPFLVYAPGGVQTKVLGTEFTVKAYTQSKDVQVMVTSGIVEVSDSAGVLGILKADQQLSYERDAHITKRTTGNLEDWRNGELTLNNASIAELVRILENRYGLQVTVKTAAIERYRFNLHISKNTSAAEMLEMLKDISGLTYTLNNNKVTIH